jgi:hypothetical protein
LTILLMIVENGKSNECERRERQCSRNAAVRANSVAFSEQRNADPFI